MTNFDYKRNLPNPPNNPSTDVAGMQINTNSNDDLIAVDHISFNNNSGGKHKQVQLKEGALPIGLEAGFETVYAKSIAGAGQLYFTRGISATEIQLTGPGDTNGVTNGHSFLPGGMLIQWGKKITPGSSGTVTFNTPFPNAVFSITLTLLRSSGNQSVTVDSGSLPSTTSFNYLSSSSGSDALYWIAIGN